METVTVVIPLYKEHISAYEQISLQQCGKVLKGYPVTFIMPHSLNPDRYLPACGGFRIERFEDHYFSGTDGYNRLMTSASFYRRFLDFRFILIYQLDAFVFRDDLSYWCAQNYDYIGAPWLERPATGTFIDKWLFRYRSYRDYKNNRRQPGTMLPVTSQFYNKVGNGGFSLRNVSKMAEICSQMKAEIEFYSGNDHHYFNEDVFWSLEVNRKMNRLNIPDYKTALRFSIEGNPEYAIEVNKNRLPFGCHAWDIYAGFWRPVFKDLGYSI